MRKYTCREELIKQNERTVKEMTKSELIKQNEVLMETLKRIAYIDIDKEVDKKIEECGIDGAYAYMVGSLIGDAKFTVEHLELLV